MVKAGRHIGWWLSKVIYPYSWPMIFRVGGIPKTNLLMLKPMLRLSNGLFLRPDNL